MFNANEKLKELWNNNKLLFLLLIPVILLVLGRNIIIDMLLKNSRKIGIEAEAKDKKLVQEIAEVNSKANQLIEENKKLDNNKKEINENWNKDDN